MKRPEKNQWSERGPATPVASADALGRLRRSVRTFAQTPAMMGSRLCCAVAGLVSWVLLCPSVGASTNGTVAAMADLPAPVAMSRGAGDGMLLFVEVRIESGETFPCSIDTGSPNTVLPARLEPRLGKRLGSRRYSTLESANEVEHLYAAPKLYLGKTRLITDPQIGASGDVGILGMDCLRHYRIQLDFQAREVRFLSSNQLIAPELGKAFPLIKLRYATIRHAGLFQDKEAELLIDTGCPFDGYLNPRAFRRAVQEQHAQSLPLFKDGAVQGTAPGMALFSQCIWDSQNYTNLIIGKRLDLVGLRFLGRHLVTFDFPGGTLYLKRTVAHGLPKRASVNLESANQSRQPTPGVRLAASRESSARRGCACSTARVRAIVMKIPGLRSSYDKVGGLVSFGRLLDKIRLNARGELPEGWVVATLGDIAGCNQNKGLNILGVGCSLHQYEEKEQGQDRSGEWPGKLHHRRRPPARTLPMGKPEDVRRELDWLVEKGPKVGLMLGCSSSITPGVPLENMKALIEGFAHYRKNGRG